MRFQFFACVVLAGCGLLDDEHPPCPSDGTGAPVPGPVIEPTSVGSGDSGASERFRKLSDGTVCVCGTYEIGCHDTPEGAESSMSCGYNAQGQPECEPYLAPPNPAFGWNNETGQDEPFKTWICPYRKIDVETKKSTSHERTESAPDYQTANKHHFDWCDNKSDLYTLYTCSACKK